jgi:MFS family permease
MGLGRCAFTPLLPLMQASGSITLADGAHLAAATYAGYLVGALASSLWPPAPHRAVTLGLLAVAATTLAMGVTDGVLVWAALRFAAGVASAYVLIGASAWALTVLIEHRRPALSGAVFAGVGVGIALTGVAGLVAALYHVDAARAWVVLGAVSTLVAVVAWPLVRRRNSDGVATTVAAAPLSASGASSRAVPWRLVLAYGAFGYGYIIPATFLPAMARAHIADPSLFGWVWPAFGAAAALSTVVVGVVFRHVAPRRLWIGGQLVLAASVVAPLARPGLSLLLVSAVGVGATFMVITMGAMQEARRCAGASAPRGMASMTTAFAVGQIVGPLTVALGPAADARAMAGPLLAAAAALVAGALALRERGATVTVADAARAMRPPTR